MSAQPATESRSRNSGGPGRRVGCACAAKPREQVYEASGFRFVPPPGWSERARHDDAPTGSTQDRLLVQYKRLTAGHHQIEFRAQSRPAGVYFYRLTAGPFHQTRRMVILK